MEMENVITLSSDSDKEDSDVEIVGCYSNVTTKAEVLPLTAVRVDVSALKVNVPTRYIDLTDPRWALPELKTRKRLNSTALAIVDLTESDVVNGTEQKSEDLPPDDFKMKNESTDETQTSNKQEKSTSRCSSPVIALQEECSDTNPNQSLDLQPQHQKQTDEAHRQAPTVKLRRLPFLESHVTELKESRRSIYLTKDCMQMSLQPRQQATDSKALDCISNMTTASNNPHMELTLEDESCPTVTEFLVRQERQENSNEFTSSRSNAEISQHVRSAAASPHSDKGSSVATSKEHIPHEDERSEFCLSMLIPSPTSSSQDKSQSSSQRKSLCSNLEQLDLHQADSKQSYLSDHPDPPTIGMNAPEPFHLDSLSNISPISHNLINQDNPTPPASEHILAENVSEWQTEEVKTDGASNSPDYLHCSIPCDSPLSMSKAEDSDEGSGTGTYRGGLDSPPSCLWQEGSDGEQVNEENRFDMDFRVASREDRNFVCPVTLRKIMSGPAESLIDEDDEGFGTPEVLCRQSLSLVYSTIDENYPEGTLQLLSDLLQPGYYPPRDISLHLLRGILLDPKCPYHLCVQAFNLLIRTQRHHIADKTTIPWDWELLTSVMTNQDHTKRHRCEVARMLLEYVVQTMEDDFQAKRSSSTLHHSIAKSTLSCDQQFLNVRDVIKWLFSAIMKSTEHAETGEAVRERDEQIRMVSIFQRMLSLALEVDRSPALNSAKLSQELFHMLIGNIPLRAHRMLLLESLQSKLLRCKLLEHLLDYACPLKITVPMSLSLLLHFMKNCTLAPDPTDGSERWQKWEELVHLLWMLLLSYNKAMKGYLCSSVSEQRGIVGTLVYKQDDMVSKPAVREAVEALLSRSQADLGQALPLHVEESLTYLQDHLLDVCQC